MSGTAIRYISAISTVSLSAVLPEGVVASAQHPTRTGCALGALAGTCVMAATALGRADDAGPTGDQRRAPGICVGSILPMDSHPMRRSHDFGSLTSGSPGEMGDHARRMGMAHPEKVLADE